MSNSGVVRYKLTVEVSEAKERSYILDFSRGWPGSNAVEFDRIHGKLTGFHDHPKVFDFRNIELAFLKLQVKVELSHPLENMAGSLFVGSWIRRSDKEVVHVDDEPSLGNHVSEGVIHKLLECDGGIKKAKEHDGGLEESFMGNEGCLPLVTIFDADIVVLLTNIKFGEVASVF